MFSRDFGRPKTAKVKIYFSLRACRGFRCGSPFGAVVVSTGGRWCRLQGLQVSCGVFRGFLPAFCPLSCFAPDVLGFNMPLFAILRRFLAGFGVWMYICMG